MHDGLVRRGNGGAGSGSASAGEVVAAVRAPTPGWRDPRLWVGLLLVTVSVVAGARLLSAADDTVPVWAAAADLGAGDTLTADDLVATRVRFAEADRLGDYFTVDDELPADLELTRGVGTGELLPRAAVGTAGGTSMLQLPVAVDAEQVPGSVGSGSVVDVYLVAPAGAGPRTKRAAPALAGVTVVEAPPLSESLTATGKRQLVLAVEEEDARRFFGLLGTAESPVLTVVRRG
jgi:hypothetical protein